MLINKDENIRTSAVYVASLILREFKNSKQNKMSIFDMANLLKKNDIRHYRQMFFGLALLYATGVIEFNEPYIKVIND